MNAQDRLGAAALRLATGSFIRRVRSEDDRRFQRNGGSNGTRLSRVEVVANRLEAIAERLEKALS